jgi:lipid-A-disaccharide synthase
MCETMLPRSTIKNATMKIFFSAGEPSGDLHGANLIRALRSRSDDIEAVGYGGPHMAEAGCRLSEDLTQLAVMWFLRVLINLHKFWNLASRADRYFRHHRPDAVVLIDFPGFNWWIARRAKAHGIPVFYFAPPQLWAWGGWRVKKMRRLVDHVLCSLPFEQTWFRERDCNATFIGHPYFDEVREQTLDEDFVAAQMQREGPLVTILPGSRTQEVTHNLRWFIKAAEEIHRRVPTARFAIASFKPHQAQIAREALKDRQLPIEVHIGRTGELIRAADCCMAVSGSVSLELLYHEKPTVILYWISPLAYFVQDFFRKVKYITLVNLLGTEDLFRNGAAPYDPDAEGAEEVLFPEYLTSKDKTSQIADRITAWITDEEARQDRVAELSDLKQRVAHGGATAKAAEYILAQFANRKMSVPRPHFVPADNMSAHRAGA